MATFGTKIVHSAWMNFVQDIFKEIYEFFSIFRGQRLAEQMQQSNPELVDQLRRQMGGPGGPPDEDQNPPPGTS